MRTIDYLTKNPVLWRRNLLLHWWAREFKRPAQTIWAVAPVLGCLPEFGSKALWPKIPCSSNIGPGHRNRELTRKPHSIRACYSSCQRRKTISSVVLLNLCITATTGPVRYPQRYNNGTFISEATNNCLMRLKGPLSRKEVILDTVNLVIAL